MCSKGTTDQPQIVQTDRDQNRTAQTDYKLVLRKLIEIPQINLGLHTLVEVSQIDPGFPNLINISQSI